VDLTVTAVTGWQLCPLESPFTVFPVHADGLLRDYVGMAISAVHWVQPASVTPVRADVAVEAFRRAMGRALEECDVDFVAVVAGMFVLRFGCGETENKENGEGE
jgi:hypothetical protein